MLAYFFSHWKRPEIEAADYEQRLRDFHRALKAAPSGGFSSSWSVALAGVPWGNHGGDSYEDWYIVQTSADLDPLNDAAISASRRVPHDQAAAAAGGGTAGLYRVRAGKAMNLPRFTAWFSKPEGWSYARLFEQLGPITSGDSALWQRQMALGPGEFCLQANAAVTLPRGIDARPLELRAVFPEGA